MMHTANMANWKLLTEFLNGIEEQVTLTWSELDAIVGGMPASASKYPAWWGSGHSHVNSWTSAGFNFTNLAKGSQVTFYRSGLEDPVAVRKTASPSGKYIRTESENAYRELPSPDLVLISCVSKKREEPAIAKDLYISDLFHKERAYAERTGVPWYILSGEHGLVHPVSMLAPYDCYLSKKPVAYRKAWGAKVVKSIVEAEGPLQEKIIEIHAAIPYIAAIRPGLESQGAIVTERWRGLSGNGEILRWYKRTLMQVLE